MMKNVLIINNRDSFVYNLVQLLRENPRCTFYVCKESELDFSNLDKYSHILLSPGPGLPQEFPNLMRVIEQCKTTHSILGVCLGMQAIALSFGAQLARLQYPKHGHLSSLRILSEQDSILRDLSADVQIGRYHSWVVDPESLTEELVLLAEDEDTCVMALRHLSLPIYGLQFHPESYLSNCGAKIIDNWLGE